MCVGAHVLEPKARLVRAHIHNIRYSIRTYTQGILQYPDRITVPRPRVNREFDWSLVLLNLAGSKKEREPRQPAEERFETKTQRERDGIRHSPLRNTLY